MRKIECFIQPSKLDQIKDALIEAGVDGMSVSEVKGFGRQRGRLNGEKPSKEVKFLPKIKLEIVVDEEIVDEVATLIVKLARTGKIGAGKIFIIPVEDAIRIRTSEAGKAAIY
ncbi:MAG: P-II family nitrogen regulator [Actinomycetota bacterium]|nr:MAG: P-II family nitrogen regulator [Actinomycetota bacterium]